MIFLLLNVRSVINLRYLFVIFICFNFAAAEKYGKYDWKIGETWACSVDIYYTSYGRIGSTEQPDFVPRIWKSYNLKFSIDRIDTFSASDICWKFIINSSLSQDNAINGCTLWIDVKDGCTKKIKGNVKAPIWKIFDKYPMPDFCATLMPMAILPWGVVDSLDAFNSKYKRSLDSISLLKGIKCDSCLSIKYPNQDNSVVEFIDYNVDCSVDENVKQVWSRKYGRWQTYEHFKQGRISTTARLQSKNGKSVKF